MYNALIAVLVFFFKDPETIHRYSIEFFKFFGAPPFASLLQMLCAPRVSPVLSQEVFGVSFAHPVGLAGGFDKNAEAVPGLSALGFSFLELGSVTSEAQVGNPRPRIFRLPKDRAIINRMGFNNEGRMAMKGRLEAVERTVPLGISLGKLKTVELPDAPREYRASFETLYEYGDYFVVNVSSPNTPGLRTLQDKDALVSIVRSLNEYRAGQKTRKPLLIKIAPDLTFSAIDEVVDVCRDEKLDGIIATNTTVSRDGLTEGTSELGGLSGAPLKAHATEIIRYIHRRAPELPIIGVGGIFTGQDAYEKIKAGASLVQIYTGFIYGGPLAVRNIAEELEQLVLHDGYKHIREAVGVSNRV